jgi:hypothetical protein
MNAEEKNIFNLWPLSGEKYRGVFNLTEDWMRGGGKGEGWYTGGGMVKHRPFPEGVGDPDRDVYPKPLPDLPVDAAPDWGDIPQMAWANSPESADKYLSDITQMVIHPIDTLAGLRNLAAGILSKVVPGVEFDETQADAFGEFLVDRYGGDEGDWSSGLRKTLATDPAGFLGDSSAFATLGAGATLKLGKISSIGRPPGRPGRPGVIPERPDPPIDPSSLNELSRLSLPPGPQNRPLGGPLEAQPVVPPVVPPGALSGIPLGTPPGAPSGMPTGVPPGAPSGMPTGVPPGVSPEVPTGVPPGVSQRSNVFKNIEAFRHAAGNLDPMTAALRGIRVGAENIGLGRGFGRGLAIVPGVLAGTGHIPIEEAVKAGFFAGERGDLLTRFMRPGNRGADDLREIVKLSQDVLAVMRQKRNEHYEKNIAPSSKDDTVLDFGLVTEALEKAIADNTRLGKTKSADTKSALEEIGKVVEEYGKEDPKLWHTVDGLDWMKQKIGSLANWKDKAPENNRAIMSMYHSVGDIIKDQAPDYAKVMEEYAEATRQIMELDKSFSLGKGQNLEAALRKLLSSMRTNVNTNYGFRLEGVRKLEEVEVPSDLPGRARVRTGAPTSDRKGAKTSINLMSRIAGAAMSEWAPKGLFSRLIGTGLLASGFVNPYLVPGALASSPRFVGEAAYFAGRAGRALRQGTDTLGRLGARDWMTSAMLSERSDEAKKRKERRMEEVLDEDLTPEGKVLKYW